MNKNNFLLFNSLLAVESAAIHGGDKSKNTINAYNEYWLKNKLLGTDESIVKLSTTASQPGRAEGIRQDPVISPIT